MGVVKRNRDPRGYCLALAAAGLLAAGSASAAAAKKVPLPQPSPRAHTDGAHVSKVGQTGQADAPKVVYDVPMPRARPKHQKSAPTTAFAGINLELRGAIFASRASSHPRARPPTGAFSVARTGDASEADIEALKDVIVAARKGRDADANDAQKRIVDPVVFKLAEWAILRSDNTQPKFARYADFEKNNPGWPHGGLFRRRAENALWHDGLSDATILTFFKDKPPTTAKGRYMLARALLAKGDRTGAAALVRKAWRTQDCSSDVEDKVIAMFGELLRREDHFVRMQRRLYNDDTEAGMRAAKRLGGTELAIARARIGVMRQLSKAKSLLDDVPTSARRDPGYVFARAQWLRQHDKAEAAERLILAAPHDAESVIDPDQWWLELRLLVRKLLDEKKPQAAYRVARDAAVPKRDNWRVDKHFTAGWIALRFLHKPKEAAAHFARIRKGTDNPVALARAGYWQGRAAEAMGKRAEAKVFYKKASKYSITYYGQLARARLGIKEVGLIGPPLFSGEERKTLAKLELVRAAEILYGLNERHMLASIYYDVGDNAADVAGMAMLAEIAAKHGDAHAMLLLGRNAHSRGLAMGYYAYPTIGLPDYKPIAPRVPVPLVFSIARTESGFNQAVISTAHAMGLMQVTPEAGRDTARRFNVRYSRKQLMEDPVYNMQFGAAELSWLYRYYNSYLLTAAAYNAGFGRVRSWIAAYGDPRDPKVDPVDWVERIPIAETRNYVQRILENLQVYRTLFGGGSKLAIEADLRDSGTKKQ